MSLSEVLSIALMLTLILTALSGYPVAITMAGTALFFAGLGTILGAFEISFLSGYASRIYAGVMKNETLLAIPLFVFLGHTLARTGLAERMLTSASILLGKRTGGLGFCVIGVGAILAATTGVVGASVVAMSLIALPSMMRAGYDKSLASGLVASSATLAQIIPPSTVLILAADLMQGIVLRGQLEAGLFTLQPVSVGDIFAGALIPGLFLVIVYALYLLWICIKSPHKCPPLLEDIDNTLSTAHHIQNFGLPLLLVSIVLGSVLFGVATANESAALGSIGALLIAHFSKQLNWQTLKDIGYETAITTGTMMFIIMAASLFSLVFRGLGGEHIVEHFLTTLPGGLFGATAVLLIVCFILGGFIDTFEILLLTLPIFGLPLIKMGADPIWLCVLMGLVLQKSFLMPPFGYALMYLKSVAPQEIETKHIWAGAMPFVGLQIIVIGLVWAFPETATFLPSLVR